MQRNQTASYQSWRGQPASGDKQAGRLLEAKTTLSEAELTLSGITAMPETFRLTAVMDFKTHRVRRAFEDSCDIFRQGLGHQDGGAVPALNETEV